MFNVFLIRTFTQYFACISYHRLPVTWDWAEVDTISYQLFWSMIQLISRNQMAVSPEAQPRVIQPSDCEI